MRANQEAITKDLARLVAVGKTMLMDLTVQYFEAQGDDKALKKLPKNASDTRDSLQENYQRWFTEAEAVIRQLIPQRRDEFVRLYQPPPNRKKPDLNTLGFKGSSQHLLGEILAPRSGLPLGFSSLESSWVGS